MGVLKLRRTGIRYINIVKFDILSSVSVPILLFYAMAGGIYSHKADRVLFFDLYRLRLYSFQLKSR